MLILALFSLIELMWLRLKLSVDNVIEVEKLLINQLQKYVNFCPQNITRVKNKRLPQTKLNQKKIGEGTVVYIAWLGLLFLTLSEGKKSCIM